MRGKAVSFATMQIVRYLIRFLRVDSGFDGVVRWLITRRFLRFEYAIQIQAYRNWRSLFSVLFRKHSAIFKYTFKTLQKPDV